MAPVPKPVELSVFDLDRTLTIVPTYTPFLLFAACSLAPWRLLLLPLLLPAALLYAMSALPRGRMKGAMHRLALGAALPRRKAARVAGRFARYLVACGLYAEGIALVEAERNAGRRVILATAAPHLYASPIAHRLGIDDVVATPSRWRDGCLIAANDTPNCFGVEKMLRVEAFLEQTGIARDDAHIRFYSDHDSDLPTFEYADEAIAVNPSTRLRAIAAQRGWRVLDWRSFRRRRT